MVTSRKNGPSGNGDEVLFMVVERELIWRLRATARTETGNCPGKKKQSESDKTPRPSARSLASNKRRLLP